MQNRPVLDLTDRVFVVTGGNGGIGLGMAEGIVEAGGAIAVWGRNPEKNRAAVARLEELGGRAMSCVCDVSSEEQVIDSMNRSIDALGRIDGLFANAGRGARPATFENTTLEDWRAVLDVNLDGVFLSAPSLWASLGTRSASTRCCPAGRSRRWRAPPMPTTPFERSQRSVRRSDVGPTRRNSARSAPSWPIRGKRSIPAR